MEFGLEPPFFRFEALEWSFGLPERSSGDKDFRFRSSLCRHYLPDFDFRATAYTCPRVPTPENRLPKFGKTT